MSKKKIFVLLLFCFILACAYSNTYASEGAGGKQEVAINKTIDTKDLSGVNLWIAKLYNEDRIMYAVVVTLVMATLGSVMAFGTDLILKRFGMTVSKISHNE